MAPKKKETGTRRRFLVQAAVSAPVLGTAAFGASVFGALVNASPAQARRSTDFFYRFEQVWTASVRMVRVDLRFEVHEQDESIGYVMFTYKDTSDRGHPGSVELVRTEVNGRKVVRAVVQVPQMPSYVEQMLLDRLERKLRQEFGDPPPPPRREPDPVEEPEEDEEESSDEDG